MKTFSLNDLPKRDKSIARLGDGVFVKKVSNEEFYACKKARNAAVFKRACMDIISYNKGKIEAEKVVKFDSIEDTLNYLNDVKIKDFKKKLDKLPAEQQKEILEQVKQKPELLFGVQKTLQLGFSDLPLFKSESDTRQTSLF